MVFSQGTLDEIECLQREQEILKTALTRCSQARTRNNATRLALYKENRELKNLLFRYFEAVGTMNEAMRDGVNVHGAMMTIVGYETMISEMQQEKIDQLFAAANGSQEDFLQSLMREFGWDMGKAMQAVEARYSNEN